MKRPRQEPQAIRAYLVLKGATENLGPGTSASPHRSEVPALEPAVRQRVGETLGKLGFSVVRASALSIAVEAPRAVFEDVFRMKLKRNDIYGRAYWAWLGSPVIPEPLADTVESVVFPQPAKVMP